MLPLSNSAVKFASLARLAAIRKRLADILMSNRLAPINKRCLRKERNCYLQYVEIDKN